MYLLTLKRFLCKKTILNSEVSSPASFYYLEYRICNLLHGINYMKFIMSPLPFEYCDYYKNSIITLSYQIYNGKLWPSTLKGKLSDIIPKYLNPIRTNT